MSKNVFEYMLVNYCAPTLKKCKMANMFHVAKDPTIKALVEECNKTYNKKGLYFILIEQTSRYTIYIYNTKLKDYINSEEIKNFLDCYEYPHSFESCLKELEVRLNSKEFPHEIGVFLGYPLQDVIGFIQNKPYYLIGDWKVYQNVEEAQKQFNLFKSVKLNMLEQIQNGLKLAEIV